MDRQAIETWGAINRARELGMDWGEVTATHTNLLAIAEVVHQRRVRLEIVRITQKRERSVGADWEFWLQSKSGSVLGYSIQAKKVYHTGRGFHYTALGHPGERSNEKQYDTLIRHSKSVGSLPYHVFYNGWPQPNAFLAFPGPWPANHYGCAAVSSYEVRHIHRTTKRRKTSVDLYLRDSMPWSELFRVPSPDSDGSAGGGVPPASPRPGPFTPPFIPAKLTQAGLLQLLDRHSSHFGDEPAALGDRLPDYVLKARELPNGSLPKSPELPAFAVIVKSA